jgi:hypothetical protein
MIPLPVMVKRTPFYTRARAVTLSVLRPNQFYNPISAALKCDVGSNDPSEILGNFELFGGKVS